MREILFRGKRKDNGEWIEGCYCGGNSWGTEVHYIVTTSSVNPFLCAIDVIPETVGQYTGLKDKNGKKIFEGDIVAEALIWQEKRKNGLVAFKVGSFGLTWYRGGIEQFNAFTSMCNIEYEVIGNIHDNGELLKGE